MLIKKSVVFYDAQKSSIDIFTCINFNRNTDSVFPDKNNSNISDTDFIGIFTALNHYKIVAECLKKYSIGSTVIPSTSRISAPI